jgi:Sec7-like guanine-nucleotide exchange factor
MLTRLSNRSDAFYASSIGHYLAITTDFFDLPLDIALRQCLLDVSLPPETQQIDRLLEAFARRYCDCNPGLYSHDTTHLLAFSLIMLSTDLCKSLLLELT